MKRFPMFDRAVPSEDQLPLFSRVGRGPKGDAFEVLLRKDADGSEHLEGVSTNHLTGESVTEWVSQPIGAGTLSHQYTLSPETGTFVLSLSYNDPTPERSWNWTSPAIPYATEEIDGSSVVRVRSVFTGKLGNKLEEVLNYPEEYNGEHPVASDDWVAQLTVGLKATFTTDGEDQEIVTIKPDATIPAANADDLSQILGFPADTTIIPAASGLSSQSDPKFNFWGVQGKTLADWVVNAVKKVTPESVIETVDDIKYLFQRNQSNIDVIRRDPGGDPQGSQVKHTADGLMLEASNLGVQEYDPNNPNQPWNDAGLESAAHASVYATYPLAEGDGRQTKAYAELYARIKDKIAQLRLNPDKDSTLELAGQDLCVSNGGLYVSGDYPIIKSVKVSSGTLTRGTDNQNAYMLPRASYSKPEGFMIGNQSYPSQNPLKFTPPEGYTPIAVASFNSNHNYTHPVSGCFVKNNNGQWGVFVRGMTFMAQPLEFDVEVICLYTGR